MRHLFNSVRLHLIMAHLIVVPVFVTGASAQPNVTQWLGGVGFWDDPFQWTSNPFYPDAGQGGIPDWIALIPNGDVTSLANVQILELQNNGQLTIDGSLMDVFGPAGVFNDTFGIISLNSGQIMTPQVVNLGGIEVLGLAPAQVATELFANANSTLVDTNGLLEVIGLNGLTFEGGGQVDVNDGGLLVLATDNGSLSVSNQTINLGLSASLFIERPLGSTIGDVSLDSVTVNGGFDPTLINDNGSIILTGTAITTERLAVTASDDITFAGSAIQIDSSATVTGNLVLNGGGTLSTDAATSLVLNGLPGQTANGSITAPNINHGGSLTVNSDGDLTITSSSSFTQSGSVTVNSGNLSVVTSAPITLADTASTTSTNSGSLDITNASGSLTVNSSGTLSADGGSASLSSSAGDVNINQDTVTGAFTASNGGDLTLRSDSNITTNGQNITVTGGAIFTADDTAGVSGDNQRATSITFNGTSLDVSGPGSIIDLEADGITLSGTSLINVTTGGDIRFDTNSLTLDGNVTVNNSDLLIESAGDVNISGLGTLDVQDSDATVTSPTLITTHGIDGGNNTNWAFGSTVINATLDSTGTDNVTLIVDSIAQNQSDGVRAATVTFDDVTIDSSNSVLIVEADTFNVSGTSSINLTGTSSFTFDGFTLNNDTQIVVAGPLSTADLTSPGPLTLDGAGDLTIDLGSADLSAGSGDITIGGTQSVRAINTSSLTITGSNSVTVAQGASLTSSGLSSLTVTTPTLDTTGTLSSSGGSLDLKSSTSDFDMSGTLTTKGTLLLSTLGSGAVSVAGDITFTDVAVAVSGNSSLSIDDQANINSDGAGSNSVTFARTSINVDTTSSLTLEAQAVDIRPSSIIFIDPTSTLRIETGSLNLGGVINNDNQLDIVGTNGLVIDGGGTGQLNVGVNGTVNVESSTGPIIVNDMDVVLDDGADIFFIDTSPAGTGGISTNNLTISGGIDPHFQSLDGLDFVSTSIDSYIFTSFSETESWSGSQLFLQSRLGFAAQWGMTSSVSYVLGVGSQATFGGKSSDLASGFIDTPLFILDGLFVVEDFATHTFTAPGTFTMQNSGSLEADGGTIKLTSSLGDVDITQNTVPGTLSAKNGGSLRIETDNSVVLGGQGLTIDSGSTIFIDNTSFIAGDGLGANSILMTGSTIDVTAGSIIVFEASTVTLDTTSFITSDATSSVRFETNSLILEGTVNSGNQLEVVGTNGLTVDGNGTGLINTGVNGVVNFESSTGPIVINDMEIVLDDGADIFITDTSLVGTGGITTNNLTIKGGNDPHFTTFGDTTHHHFQGTGIFTADGILEYSSWSSSEFWIDSILNMRSNATTPADVSFVLGVSFNADANSQITLSGKVTAPAVGSMDSPVVVMDGLYRVDPFATQTFTSPGTLTYGGIGTTWANGGVIQFTPAGGDILFGGGHFIRASDAASILSSTPTSTGRYIFDGTVIYEPLDTSIIRIGDSTSNSQEVDAPTQAFNANGDPDTGTAGGEINIKVGGDVNIGRADASASTGANAAAGGTIRIETNGTTKANDFWANGGEGGQGFAGAPGGEIFIDPKYLPPFVTPVGDVEVDDIFAKGGDGKIPTVAVPGGDGGKGGTITIGPAREVRIGGDVSTKGGDGSLANPFWGGSVGGEGGEIYIDPRYLPPVVTPIDFGSGGGKGGNSDTGGTGGKGGGGGRIEIELEGTLPSQLGKLTANGGDGGNDTTGGVNPGGGGGAGGTVKITAKNLLGTGSLQANGAGNGAGSSPGGGGGGGRIVIDYAAAGDLDIDGNISASGDGGGGGQVDVTNAGGLADLTINAPGLPAIKVDGGTTGDGGDVTLDLNGFDLGPSSSGFSANATGTGNGGNITVDTATNSPLTLGPINAASSGSGNGGTVSVTSSGTGGVTIDDILATSTGGGSAGSISVTSLFGDVTLDGQVNIDGGGQLVSDSPTTFLIKPNLLFGAGSTGQFTGDVEVGSDPIKVTMIVEGNVIVNDDFTYRGTGPAAEVTVQGGGDWESQRIDVTNGIYNIAGGEVRVGTLDGPAGTFNMTGGRLKVDTANRDLVIQGGTLAPGNSPGLTTVNGDFSLGGSLEIELGGLTAGTGFDQLVVTNDVVLNTGATLDALLMNPYVPTIGDSFLILDAGTLTGKFDTVLLPSFAGASLGVQYGASTVTLLTGLAGDLNGDGFVGIADLNIVLANWNQNVDAGVWLSGDPTGEGFVGIDDLNEVLGNWNAGTPPGESANIPEPATLALLGTAVLLWPRRRDA